MAETFDVEIKWAPPNQTDLQRVEVWINSVWFKTAQIHPVESTIDSSLIVQLEGNKLYHYVVKAYYYGNLRQAVAVKAGDFQAGLLEPPMKNLGVTFLYNRTIKLILTDFSPPDCYPIILGGNSFFAKYGDLDLDGTYQSDTGLYEWETGIQVASTPSAKVCNDDACLDEEGQLGGLSYFFKITLIKENLYYIEGTDFNGGTVVFSATGAPGVDLPNLAVGGRGTGRITLDTPV